MLTRLFWTRRRIAQGLISLVFVLNLKFKDPYRHVSRPAAMYASFLHHTTLHTSPHSIYSLSAFLPSRPHWLSLTPTDRAVLTCLQTTDLKAAAQYGMDLCKAAAASASNTSTSGSSSPTTSTSSEGMTESETTVASASTTDSATDSTATSSDSSQTVSSSNPEAVVT